MPRGKPGSTRTTSVTGEKAYEFIEVPENLIRQFKQRRSEQHRLVEETLKDITFPGLALETSWPTDQSDWCLVSIYIDVLDVFTGNPTRLFARRWIDPMFQQNHIVQTIHDALKCLLLHELDEQFSYKGKRILLPHWDLDRMLALADPNTLNCELPAL